MDVERQKCKAFWLLFGYVLDLPELISGNYGELYQLTLVQTQSS